MESLSRLQQAVQNFIGLEDNDIASPATTKDEDALDGGRAIAQPKVKKPKKGASAEEALDHYSTAATGQGNTEVKTEIKQVEENTGPEARMYMSDSGNNNIFSTRTDEIMESSMRAAPGIHNLANPDNSTEFRVRGAYVALRHNLLVECRRWHDGDTPVTEHGTEEAAEITKDTPIESPLLQRPLKEHAPFWDEIPDKWDNEKVKTPEGRADLVNTILRMYKVELRFWGGNGAWYEQNGPVPEHISKNK